MGFFWGHEYPKPKKIKVPPQGVSPIRNKETKMKARFYFPN